jgi:hypothetical protein
MRLLLNVSAVLLVASVAALVWWRGHRRKKKAAAAAADTEAAPSQSSNNKPSPVPSSLVTVATYPSTGKEDSDIVKGLQCVQHSLPCSSFREGWSATHSMTCSAYQAVQDNGIEFGRCLYESAEALADYSPLAK